MSDGITVTANVAALSAALRKFTDGALPSVIEVAARKIALDVVGTVSRGLTRGGDGTPRRVDTGRLRAGWRAGAKAAGLPVSGLRGGGAGGAGAEGSKGSDGFGSSQSSGAETTINIGNGVEYAQAVEFGTSRMAPGNHLTRALIIVRRDIPGETGEGSIQDEIAKAWESG